MTILLLESPNEWQETLRQRLGSLSWIFKSGTSLHNIADAYAGVEE